MGIISLKLYSLLYSSILGNISPFFILSILFRISITGLVVFSSKSMMNLSPLPSGVEASVRNKSTSTSSMVKKACLFNTLPSLFFDLWV